MSVKVRDLLKLPSLVNAEVVAGSNGLDRLVSSISVLEYASTEKLQSKLFDSKDFIGNEIVISAFANIKDDVEAQCTNIRRLAGVGEVGLILFYVGLIIPEIDNRLIKLANELNFVLICMPKNTMELRYSEVIVEVMEAIINDKEKNKYFISEILEIISKMPQPQQNIESVLKLLSDRLKISLILANKSFDILNLVSWPRNLIKNATEIIEQINFNENMGKEIELYINDKIACASVVSLLLDDGQQLYIIIVKSENSLSKDYLRQTTELIKISLNLWSKKHSDFALSELIRAMLDNETINMRRLADFFNIDIAAINTMWVLLPQKNQIHNTLAIAKETLKHTCKTLVADIYRDAVILFIDNKSVATENLTYARELYKILKDQNIEVDFVACSALCSIKDARDAFLDIIEYISETKLLYKKDKVYSLQEVVFFKDCKKIIDEGEQAVEKIIKPLNYLMSKEKAFNFDPIETLQVFFLDAQTSVSKTSELMFVHKNTIKYRIRLINERLCYPIYKIPEANALYLACAVLRILDRYNQNK